MSMDEYDKPMRTICSVCDKYVDSYGAGDDAVTVGDVVFHRACVPPRKPLAIGGVLRCCVATLDRHEGSQDEGTVLPCLYCQSALHVKDGKWQWFREYDKPPLTQEGSQQ